MTVLLFASIAEKAGTRRLRVPLETGDTVADVRERVVARYPQLQVAVPTLLYAVHEEYAKPGDPVEPGATVALIPPVSGG